MNDYAQMTLIDEYCTALVEPGCHPGEGKYGVRVTLREDISAVFPYLNAEWHNASYDPDNQILIWGNSRQRYALRPLEIRIGRVVDQEAARDEAARIVANINDVWARRDSITPSDTRKRKPSALALFALLPKSRTTSNCGKCGHPTCLAYANALREGDVTVDDCPPLGAPDAEDCRQSILALFEQK